MGFCYSGHYMSLPTQRVSEKKLTHGILLTLLTTGLN